MQSKMLFTAGERTLPYLFYCPKSYSIDENKEWPLLLFLHGAGERGDSLDGVKAHGPSKFLDGVEDFPCLVAAPQCPEDSYWPLWLTELEMLLDRLINTLKVDRRRIYLTGLSMGAIGGWQLAVKNLLLFAAFAPVCGAMSLPASRKREFPDLVSEKQCKDKIVRLKNLPIWAFHGDEDDVVPLEETDDMINQLQENGGRASLTIYKGVGHDSWTETYKNPALYEWLFAQKREDKEILAE
ncbi:dienelactone hydrolase family protein [Alteribacillus sp. HJP-4]|uniref:carboxylesterase family protein n=1 Tax=Alteribacillus sp. HJP-4 TaxID=2775394 RepID=UPI0035CCD9F7